MNDGSWLNLLPQLAAAGFDIYSLVRGTDKSAASDAANIANPLLPLQGQARTDMASFMRDPSSVLKDPAFLAAENLGAENVSRYYGSRGLGSSGNNQAALFNYGQTAGLNYEDQRYRQLLGLLQPSPAAAAFNFGGALGQQNKWADLIKQLAGGTGVTGALATVLKLLGGGGGGGSMGTWPSGPGLTEGPTDNPGGTFWTPPELTQGPLDNPGGEFWSSGVGTEMPPIDDSWLTGMFGT